MKRHRVKKYLRQLGKTCVLFLVIGFILDGFFLNESFADPFPGKLVIASSLNDFTETILEKSFETPQFAWAKLKALLGSDSNSMSTSLFEILKERPLVLASIVLMVAGAFFVIHRSRKTKAEQRRILTNLRKSLGEDEDDYEGNRPLFPAPSQTEEDLDDDDDEARPLFPDEDAKDIESGQVADSDTEEPFISAPNPTAEPDEPEQVLKAGHDEEVEEEDTLQVLENEPAEDGSFSEEKTVTLSPGEETEEDEILKKLEEEFAQLESEFQDADIVREEMTESTPEKEDSPKTVSSHTQKEDNEAGSLETYPFDAVQKEAVEEDETDADDTLSQNPVSDEPDEDEDINQSIVDLQAEIEQTAQDISDQLENEKDVFDIAPAEPSPEKGPAIAVPAQEKSVDEAPLAVSPPNEPEPVAQQPVDIPSPEAIAEYPAVDSQPTVERESKPLAEKKTPLDSETAHRRINQLVNFQKNLEEQLDKMSVLNRQGKTEGAASVQEEASPEDFALQPAEQNYEQIKNSLKQKDSLDLLESFILLANQKKDD